MVRIPMNSATCSDPKPPVFPIQKRHPFRFKAATVSDPVPPLVTWWCQPSSTTKAELSTAAGGRRLRRTHDRRGGQLVFSAQDVLAGLRRHCFHRVPFCRDRCLLIVAFFLALRPHRFTDKFDAVRAADDAVQDRIGHRRVAVAQIVVPTLHRKLAGHDGRALS
jgi:hypothetical protein